MRFPNMALFAIITRSFKLILIQPIPEIRTEDDFAYTRLHTWFIYIYYQSNNLFLPDSGIATESPP